MKLPNDTRVSAGNAACLALLDAFDPDRSAMGRRASMLRALELAMEATGHARADAIALLAQWCQDLRS